MARDYYAVLGLPPTADEKAIKAAYKRLAHQYHPENAGDPKDKWFRLISEAYNTLSDVSRRSQYDARRRPAECATTEFCNRSPTNYSKVKGLSDKLGDFFARKIPPVTHSATQIFTFDQGTRYQSPLGN